MSCIAKLLECIQAGFQKGHSCEDQVLQIVQAIKNGFQKKPMQRSVLALLDFREAFDTVWREKLLLHMLSMGILATIIRWLHYFLND